MTVKTQVQPLQHSSWRLQLWHCLSATWYGDRWEICLFGCTANLAGQAASERRARLIGLMPAQRRSECSMRGAALSTAF